jgi:hypothetical protein
VRLRERRQRFFSNRRSADASTSRSIAPRTAAKPLSVSIRFKVCDAVATGQLQEDQRHYRCRGRRLVRLDAAQ